MIQVIDEEQSPGETKPNPPPLPHTNERKQKTKENTAVQHSILARKLLSFYSVLQRIHFIPRFKLDGL